MELKIQNCEPLQIWKRQMHWIAILHNMLTLTQQNSRLKNKCFPKFMTPTELHIENKPNFLHSDLMICLHDILPQIWRISQNDMCGHRPVSDITKTAIALELLLGQNSLLQFSLLKKDQIHERLKRKFILMRQYKTYTHSQGKPLLSGNKQKRSAVACYCDLTTGTDAWGF